MRVTPVVMTLFMQFEGVEQKRQLTAIPATLRTHSAATAPQPFPVQMIRDHYSQMTKFSFQLRRWSSCLTPLPLSQRLLCQVPWQRRSFWILSVRKFTYCGAYGKQARYATVAKGRVRRFWSRVISNEYTDPCCTTRQLSIIEYLQTVTGPLTVSLTFGSPPDS
jgi:hypothetical protein